MLETPQPNQHQSHLKFLEKKNLGTPGIDPGAAGCEARILSIVLLWAPPPTFLWFKIPIRWVHPEDDKCCSTNRLLCIKQRLGRDFEHILNFLWLTLLYRLCLTRVKGDFGGSFKKGKASQMAALHQKAKRDGFQSLRGSQNL